MEAMFQAVLKLLNKKERRKRWIDLNVGLYLEALQDREYNLAEHIDQTLRDNGVFLQFTDHGVIWTE